MNLRRAFLLVSCGIIVLLFPPPLTSGAQDAKTEKDRPKAPSQVEVRFLNGSVVVMALLQEKIDIMTDYGKLTIPHKDVRHIEFGIRTSEEERTKIEVAFSRLGSDVYKEREAAVRDLVALGPMVYTRLRTVAAAENQEAAKRAETAIKKIQEKFHPKLLRLREDDVVHTTKFAIVGHILTTSIKGKADEFGELDLRPAKLLAIRRLEGESRKDVVVDAAAYGNQGARKWLDTGVRVEAHMGLKVTANGQVDLWPQQAGTYIAGPDGQGQGGPGGFGGLGGVVVMNGRRLQMGGGGASGGELLGKIGENGAPFIVGSRFAQAPKDVGKLYLQIMPSPWGGPSAGEYRVSIATGSFPVDGERDD